MTLDTGVRKLVFTSVILLSVCAILAMFRLPVWSGFLLLVYSLVSFRISSKTLLIRLPPVRLILATLAFISIALLTFLPSRITQYYNPESLCDIALFAIPALYLCSFFTGYAVSEILGLRLPRLLSFLFDVMLGIFISALTNLIGTNVGFSSRTLLLTTDLILAITLITLRGRTSVVSTSINSRSLFFIIPAVLGIAMILAGTMTNLLNFNDLDMWRMLDYAVPIMKGVAQPWAIPGGYTAASYPSLNYNFVANYLSLVPGDSALAFLLLFPLSLLPFISFYVLAGRILKESSEVSLATLLYVTLAGISWMFLLVEIGLSPDWYQIVVKSINGAFDNYLSWALPMYATYAGSVLGLACLFVIIALIIDERVSLRNLLICGPTIMVLDFSIHSEEILPLAIALFITVLVVRRSRIKHRISLFTVLSAVLVIIFAVVLQPSSYYLPTGLLTSGLLLTVSLFSNVLMLSRKTISCGSIKRYHALASFVLEGFASSYQTLRDYVSFLAIRFGVVLVLVAGAVLVLRRTASMRTVYHVALYLVLLSLVLLSIGAVGFSISGVTGTLDLSDEILGRFITPAAAVILSMLFVYLWRSAKRYKRGILIRVAVVGLILTTTLSTVVIAQSWLALTPSPTSIDELQAFSFLRGQLGPTDYIVAPSPDTQAKLSQFAGVTYQSLFELSSSFFSSENPTFVLFLVSHPRPSAPGQIRYVLVTPEDQIQLNTVYASGFFVKGMLPYLPIVYSKGSVQIYYIPDTSTQIDPTQKLVVTPDTLTYDRVAWLLARANVKFATTDLSDANLDSSSTILLPQDPTLPIWVANFSQEWEESGNITLSTSNNITTITGYSIGRDSWATTLLPVSINSLGESPYATLVAKGRGVKAPFFVEFRDDIGKQYAYYYVQDNLSRSVFTTLYLPLPTDMRVTAVRLGFHFADNSQAGNASIAIKWLGIGLPAQEFEDWVMDGGHLVVFAPATNGFFSNLSDSNVLLYNGSVTASLSSAEVMPFYFSGLLAIPFHTKVAFGTINNLTSSIAPISFDTDLGLGSITILNGGLFEGNASSAASERLLSAVLSQEKLALNENATEDYVGTAELPLILTGTGNISVSGLEASWPDASQEVRVSSLQGDRDLSVSNLLIQGPVEISYNSSVTIVSEEDSVSSFGIELVGGGLSLHIGNPSTPVFLTATNGQNLVVEALSIQFDPLQGSLLHTDSIDQFSVDGKVSSPSLFLAPGEGAATSKNSATLALVARFDLLSTGNAYMFLGSTSPQNLAQSISYQDHSWGINSRDFGYVFLALVAFCLANLIVTPQLRKRALPRVTP